MTDFERSVTFSPAFDRRDPDPSKDYGIHGVDLRMVLKCGNSAVQFVLYTGWMLSHVRDEHESTGYHSKPLPADVGYHSPRPMYEGQESFSDDCEYTGGVCYCDGSGLAAEPMFDLLCSGGSDAVWAALEKEWADRFAEVVV